MFPHLAKEIEDGVMTFPIGGVRWSNRSEEYDELRNPDVISFIRRCRTEKEAEEIIDYMERRGEISHEYAESLRRQLREKGLRSFGEYKPYGYYFRKYYRRSKVRYIREQVESSEE
ncbi:MAG: DUF2095 domain-containing protein [Thermoprotei archaeon]|nr:MAG: DUF2095 domain-containing protein [Thermoprotei archaeon]RLF25058.1 MAG: DUF2095 domain-containing protein [Thermoprotei archaeon]